MLGVFLSCAVSFAAAWASPQTDKYPDIQAFMRQVAQSHPENVQLFQLGVSDSGEMIEGLKIGSGDVHNLVVATHHGNEYGSTEVAKAFAASLADEPLIGQTVFVIPVLNIYGYNTRRRGEDTPTNVYDPNRDYPGPCGTAGPHKLKSTALLASFIDHEQIVASATLHTFHPAVVYPWGLGTHDFLPPHLDLFTMLVKAATVESGYATGNSTDVIYPANGTFEDYAFWRHGIWSILFELGRSHKPSDNDVSELVRVNVPGLRRMLASAPRERATDHEFHGKCDKLAFLLDRHDE